MPFLELFEQAAEHVSTQGIDVTLKCGLPVTAWAIEQARTNSVIPIPDELCDVYMEMGDGFLFRWQDGEEGPSAIIEFPEIAEVAVASLSEINRRVEWSETYDFRFTENPTLARTTAMRMRKWLGFHDEGNGDRFCFDTGLSKPPVVFDHCSWFDGGTGSNGHVLGSSLLEFYRAWSSVCFQTPVGLWWPGVFREPSGVDWESSEFSEVFRLR